MSLVGGLTGAHTIVKVAGLDYIVPYHFLNCCHYDRKYNIFGMSREFIGLYDLV